MIGLALDTTRKYKFRKYKLRPFFFTVYFWEGGEMGTEGGRERAREHYQAQARASGGGAEREEATESEAGSRL